MKKIALGAVVGAAVCLAASVSAGETLEGTWVVAKDSCFRGKSSYLKRGGYNANRIVTSTWDGMWFGDWTAGTGGQREAISAEMAKDPGVGMKWELRLEVMNSSTTALDGPPYEWAVAAFKALVDWDETDVCFESPNYTGTPNLWQKIDGSTVTKFGSGDTTIDVDHVINTRIFSGLPAIGTYTSVVLDRVVRSWILDSDPANYVRGLVFVRNRTDDGSMKGLSIVTDEGNNVAQKPRLALYKVAATPGVYSWVAGGGADNKWSTAANWEENAAPALLTDTALFTVTAAYAANTVAIGAGNQQIGTVNMNGGGRAATLSQDGASTLEVGTSFTFTNGGLTINVPLLGAGSMSLSPSAASTISKANQMTGGLSFTGSTSTTTLTLSVAGSGGGTPSTKAPITVNQGLLSITNANALDNVSTVTLAGGGLLGPAAAGGLTVNNDIPVTADSYVNLRNVGTPGPAGDFTLAGRLSGAGRLTVTTNDDGRGSRLILTNDNTAGTPWSGGLDVTRGTVEAKTSAGALGTGPIVAREGGTIRTSVDGAFTGTGSVSIQAGGTWLQNSTETGAVTIESRGALLKDAGGTLSAAEFNPAGGHITLNKGAMINKAAFDLINAGFDRTWLAGDDGGYGVWLANSNVDASVGDGIITGVPLRGVSATMYSTDFDATDRQPYFIYKSTLSEAAGGSLGIFLSAASLQTGLQIGTGTAGAGNAATLTPLPGHKIHVTGPGVVVLKDSNTINGDIDVATTGNGWLRLGWTGDTTSVIPGRTVTVKSGAAAESYTSAGTLDGGTIVVEGGGVFRTAAAYTGVTGSVAQGGVLVTASLANVSVGGSPWTFASGSHIALSATYASPDLGATGAYPGRGVSNFVLLSAASPGNTFTPGSHLYLNDNTRVMGVSDTVNTYNMTLAQGTYQVRPFAGSTKVTLAAETGRTMTVSMKVNANTNSNDVAVSGTLLVGDERVGGSPGTFRTYAGFWGSAAYTPPNNPFPGLRDVVTTGTVILGSSANAMEAINLRSGTLQVGITKPADDALAGYLGNAKTIRVATGATLVTFTSAPTVDQTLSTIFTGGAGASAADRAYVNLRSTALALNLKTVAGAPAGVNPGDGPLAGQLTFNCGLAFATDTGTGPMVTIDITGGGGAGLQPVAGTDYDQIVALGAVTGIGGANLTVNFASGLRPSDVEITDEFTILTTTSDLSGQAFASVTVNSGLLTPVYGAGFVKLTNVQVRIPGDADLNGYVDLPDLIALARNWKVTPATWAQGDFDGDTVVDLPDLIILARNWHAGAPPPPAGGAVPEPACLALLALGGLALVRRRRR